MPEDEDVIRSIRMPVRVWNFYSELAYQNDRTPAAEIRLILESGLIPHKGKVNTKDTDWPRKADKKGK